MLNTEHNLTIGLGTICISFFYALIVGGMLIISNVGTKNLILFGLIPPIIGTLVGSTIYFVYRMKEIRNNV